LNFDSQARSQAVAVNLVPESKIIPRRAGQKSKIVFDLLRAYESRNVSFISPDGSWPIVWERAKGLDVWDAEGKKYLDLTAAFGVAAAGHANPRVVRAGQEQMARLLHAMGDVHPHPLKARLARELSRITFERWSMSDKCRVSSGKSRATAASLSPATCHPSLSGKTIFCNSGFEAVEAGLKTAMMATGRPGVIAFTGAYHGLGYGTLNATHRAHFRSPFQTQLGEFGHFVPFPKAGRGEKLCAVDSKSATSPESCRDRQIGNLGSDKEQREGERGAPRTLEAVEAQMRRLFRRKQIGAVLVEPIQGRGGINIPPAGFLPLLRRLCDEHQALLILDEVFTGFGRTGKWFACEHTATVPDLICLGKALTGGFPLSACVGRADRMDAAWPASDGEAIHTSTFLGHPVGCAMALAQIAELERRDLVKRSAELGEYLLNGLRSEISSPALQLSIRGVGLLAGVELRLPSGLPATRRALEAIQIMLQRRFILLPEGEHSNVLTLTPPLTISQNQLQTAVEALSEVLNHG
jgi:4-aminobutyrate aminotransferase-like enzyme